MRKVLLLVCWMSGVGLAGQAQAQTYTMPATGATTITTCAGNLYDNGGPTGPYSSNSNGTTTIVPATAGNKVKLVFNSFSLDYYDALTIYDGNSASAPIVGTYSGNFSPGTVYATTSSGALTIRLSGTNYYGYSGFDASISCVTTVPQPDLAVQGASAFPATVVSGGTIQASCSIYNLSGTTATSSSVGYYLSTDATLGATDVLLSNSPGGSLFVGGSSTRSSFLQLGANVTPGNYYLLFVADYLNAVGESNEQNNVATVSINVAAPNYDLVIQQPTATPASVAQGGSLSLSSSINNLGNATATSSSVGYYLSTDATLDATDALLTSTFGSALAPGFPSSRFGATNIPLNTPTGTYYILFVADYQNLVSESNEQNNVASFTITVSPPGVDLIVQQPSLYNTSMTAGSSSNVYSMLRNQGNISAGNSSVGYYLSANTTLDANDVLLSSSTNGTLGAGQSTSVYGLFTLPASTAPGNYYVLFVADYLAQVTEVNEQNNVVSTNLTVLPPNIDLVIQQPTRSAAVAAAGSTIDVTNYVSNQGSTAAGASELGYYLSANTTLDANDVLLSSQAVSGISGFSSTFRSAQLTIPTGTANGLYYVLYVADRLNAVTETNENNNVASLSLTVAPPSPDFTVTQAGLSRTTASAGTSMSGGAYVGNIGTSLAPANSLSFYLSTDAIFSSSDVLLTSVSTTSISSGFGSSYNGSFTIPSSTTAGFYYVLMVADAQNQVTEANEQNNVAAASLQVTAPFNGTVVPFTGTQTITTCNTTVYDAGGTGDYDYNSNGRLVIMPGTSGAKVRLTLNFLRTEYNYDYLRVYDGTSTNSTMLANLTGIGQVGQVFTATSASGALTLEFTSDNIGNDAGFEATVSCITPGLPDLITQQVTASLSSVSAGSLLGVSSTVRNQGPGEASGSVVGYYLSTNTTLDANDVLLGNSSGGALSASASATRNGSFFIPTSTASGSYYLLGVADPQNTVTETNEGNNVTASSSLISVTGSNPDLAVSQLTVLPAGLIPRGGNISVTCFHTNQGLVTAGAHNVGVYLSTDANWSSNDVLLNTTNYGAMNPSFGITRVIGGISIPVATVPGTYFVLFVADPQNAVAETNEQNNVASRQVQIDINTAVREQAGGYAINLQPNPAANGAFEVRFDGAGLTAPVEMMLLNSLGQEVGRQKLTLRGTAAKAVFSTRGLSRGVYTLRISGQDLHATRRVVVE